MSGVVIRAAAARKPLLASAFGLMGALVQNHRLGIAVDAREPAAIAEALLDLLDQPSGYTSVDEMTRLQEAHRPEAFAATLFDAAYERPR